MREKAGRVDRKLIIALLISVLCLAVCLTIFFRENIGKAFSRAVELGEQAVQEVVQYVAQDTEEDTQNSVIIETVEQALPKIPEGSEPAEELTSISLDVDIIYQFPNMPSGCEITALTMALNYIGIDVTNYELADNYLDCSTYDMYQSFIGSVYSDSSFGCYAPVIERAADDYFADNGLDYDAVNISGSSREEILEYLFSGTPIVIWNTIDMLETYEETFVRSGVTFTWNTNEHCVVLCGYDKESNTVTVADSISGLVTRDADTFFQRYEDMYSQAVYIVEK